MNRARVLFSSLALLLAGCAGQPTHQTYGYYYPYLYDKDSWPYYVSGWPNYPGLVDGFYGSFAFSDIGKGGGQ
ncbi:MAG: hypothetical protein JO278_05495 [Dyella sp.]|nr:hypothetical protein [Dyella sp.]